MYTVTTYEELRKFVLAFADTQLGLLILVGGPGLGKSRMLKESLPPKHGWIEGSSTAFGMYCKAWEHRDQLLVFDDIDGLFRDRDSIRLLKLLCQTERVKTLTWNSGSTTLKHARIPPRFKTTSKVAIISNDWQTLNENVEALQDRGHVIEFRPSALEVHTATSGWFWDQEVFDFVAGHLHLITTPSQRYYLKGWELRKSGLDWRSLLLQLVCQPAPQDKLLLVAQLLADPRYQTQEERATAFTQLGGGCRATFYLYVRKLPPRVEVPKIILAKSSPPEKGQSDYWQLLRNRFGQLGNG